MEQAATYTSKLLVWFGEFGPKLLGATIVFIIGLYITNFLGKLVTKALHRKDIDASLQTFMGSLVSGALKVLLLISVAGILGIQTTSFVAVIGALGLAVGLALQGSLANFAGGVLLLVFKPFKIGDLIESGGQTGFVQEIQIFNTVLLTPENKTAILANAAVSNGTVVNYSKHGNLRVDITMSLAPDCEIAFARKVAIETMNANQFVLKIPEPTFNVLKVADGMITFAVRPYSTPANYWDAFFTVQEDIRNAFDNNSISGPSHTHVVIHK
ncbi:MAG: mechanosensitive ion channel [Ignavibacteria bacterium]|nr:mechanosensitive ion channel [Ignavibacteria bacterium]